ncbi:DUF748 domain-containing protein [Pseudohongiella sp.]|uniref:DUF748 domain-containing protein n=1 Tax=marine sediment metagenome TaxID=412755 RepID=A0A0F9W0T5_9ZZZZ|nr:DUF748 domain-containing protein [Pseudohongiella sp.]HDZ08304.1 DUF748 domain-containing protein [Pseudohongiella sp.]HEA62580.1 DUF748 domain-containing protein [Pseudohongiella sp.]
MLERTRHKLSPRRPWLWLLLTLLLYTLAGFVLAPWLIERQLVSMSTVRADLTTTVDNIDINPYTLTFTLEGLDVIDSEAAPLLALERVFVNFELISAIRRAWSFDEFHIIGLNVALERYSDGGTNVGAVAERWMATAAPQEEAPEPPQEGEPVRLVIADLVVASASLSLVDNVPEERFEARVDALELDVQNLSTLPDDTAGQGLTVTMGNGAVLNWTGTSSLYPLHSEGRVTLQGAYPGLAFEYFRSQLPFDMSGGEIDAALDYRVGTDADGSLSADITDIQFSMLDTLLSDGDSGERLVSLPEISLENGELHWPANTVSLDVVRLRGSEFQAVRAPDGTINFVALMQAMPAPQASAASQTGQASQTAQESQESQESPTETEASDADDATDPWQISVAELALEDWLLAFNDRVPEQNVTAELGLNATLVDISSMPDAQMQLDSSVTVASGGALSLTGTLVALPQLQFDGEIGLQDLELAVLQPYIDPFARVSLDQGRVGMDGTIAVTANSQRYRGNMLLSDLALTDRIESERLFSLDSLQVNGIVLEQRDEPSLNVDEIRIVSPYARVEIREDGTTNIGSVLISSGENDSETGSEQEQESGTNTGDDSTGTATQLMALLLDRMVIDSARVDFADRSLPLPFAVSMSSLGGDISALSTRSEQPAAIDLEGQVGEFGEVNISGELRPFAYTENTQVNLAFRNIDMPTMSPYVIDFAGRRIDDGSLDVDLDYNIEDGRIAGDNEVIMRDLVLGERVPHPGAADLPLDLAVALLQNSNGVINLGVPVSGDINNPQFGFGQVIRRALTSAITSIVSSPFRFLAGLVGSEDEDLAVIGFAAGRSDVSPAEQQKLIKLADALTQRPQLKLQVPPVLSTQADEKALAQRLLDQQIETRMSALQTSGAGDLTATGRRVAALEQMLVDEGMATEESAADAPDTGEPAADNEGPVSLGTLRLMHMITATDNEDASLDELAYAASLRTRLLEQQAVPAEELDALARQRAQQVLAVITESREALQAQVEVTEMIETDVNDDGQVVMTLEVEIGG